MIYKIVLRDVKAQAFTQSAQHAPGGVAHKRSFGQLYSSPEIAIIESESQHSTGFELAVDLCEIESDYLKGFVMEEVYGHTKSKLSVWNISQHPSLDVVFSQHIAPETALVFRSELAR